MEQVEVFFAFGALVRANDHFLRAAAGGDQADARFDQADVGFRRGVDARAVQTRLRSRRRAPGPAARRPPACGECLMASVVFWNWRTARCRSSHSCSCAVIRMQHQVRAGGKILALIGDHHGVEIGAQPREALVNHGQQVAADGVHLGVEFAADHAVAQIDQAGAGIFLDFLAALLQRFQNDDAFGLRHGLVGLAGKIEIRCLALRRFVERFLPGGKQLRDQRRQRLALLFQLPGHGLDADGVPRLRTARAPRQSPSAWRDPHRRSSRRFRGTRRAA